MVICVGPSHLPSTAIAASSFINRRTFSSKILIFYAYPCLIVDNCGLVEVNKLESLGDSITTAVLLSWAKEPGIIPNLGVECILLGYDLIR